MKTTATGTLPKENGDLRTAIVDVLLNDDAVMQTLIDDVSEALVSKLLASNNFMSTLQGSRPTGARGPVAHKLSPGLMACQIWEPLCLTHPQ